MTESEMAQAKLGLLQLLTSSVKALIHAQTIELLVKKQKDKKLNEVDELELQAWNKRSAELGYALSRVQQPDKSLEQYTPERVEVKCSVVLKGFLKKGEKSEGAKARLIFEAEQRVNAGADIRAHFS